MFIEKIALFYSDNLKPKKLTWGGGSLLNLTENIMFTYKERTQWCGLMK